MAKGARLAAGALGKFSYGVFNASLRWLMPYADGDRRRLTPAVHAQYLAPFSERDARVRVLGRLACALLGSSAHYQRLWARRETLGSAACAGVVGRRGSRVPGALSRTLARGAAAGEGRAHRRRRALAARGSASPSAARNGGIVRRKLEVARKQRCASTRAVRCGARGPASVAPALRRGVLELAAGRALLHSLAARTFLTPPASTPRRLPVTRAAFASAARVA